MQAKKFGRIVNITSGSVKMPLAGLDLSSGARAGLTAFLAGVARQVAANNVTINFILPGTFATDRLMTNMEATAKKQGITVEQASKARMATVPAKRFGEADEFRRGLRVPLLGTRRLHHRAKSLDRRRGIPLGRSEPTGSTSQRFAALLSFRPCRPPWRSRHSRLIWCRRLRSRSPQLPARA
jgi:hypothetical protein